MKKSFKYIFILLLSFYIHSCFSEKFEFIGEKKIINKEEWRVKLYQLDKFEMLTPVDYEIVNEHDSLISERHWLTGTDANLQNVDRFYAKIQDSILYICYPYPRVEAIKHLSDLDGPNQWDLLKELQKYDLSLYKQK